MEDTILAYTAGLLDGEGYIGIEISNPKDRYVSMRYRMSVQIGMTHEPTIRWLQETFGFTVYIKAPDFKNRRTAAYIATLPSLRAANFLRQVQPWVKTKSNQVALAILFQDTCTAYRTTPQGVRLRHNRVTEEEVARRHSLYEQMRILNGRLKGPQEHLI